MLTALTSQVVPISSCSVYPEQVLCCSDDLLSLLPSIAQMGLRLIKRGLHLIKVSNIAYREFGIINR